jgi:hypothetical protein
MGNRHSIVSHRDQQASVRLHLVPDRDDPLVFLVTGDSADGQGIPVIPTAMAHSYWACVSLDEDDTGSGGSATSPSDDVVQGHPSAWSRT